MDFTNWIDLLRTELSIIVDQTLKYLPRLLFALVIMLAGWLVAKLARAISVRLLIGIDRLWHRFISNRALEQFQPRYPPAKIAGEIIFWFIIMFFVAGAASILGLGTFVSWLSKVATYIPILLTGLLIILAGVIISALVRDLIISSAISAGIPQSDLLGRIAQMAILLVTVIVGADQIGIDVSFLSIIVGVLTAVTFGGIALAFGAGAKDFVANIISAHQLRQTLRIGDKMHIHGMDGVILEVTSTKVILDTNQGRVIVPAKHFEQEVVVLRDRGETNGT